MPVTSMRDQDRFGMNTPEGNLKEHVTGLPPPSANKAAYSE